jgi:hypothetical protein
MLSITKALTAQCLAFLLVLCLHADARAWEDHGHRIVGAVAYIQMAPPTRQAVGELLARDYDKHTAKDFISRTTWADQILANPKSFSAHLFAVTPVWHFADVDVTEPRIDRAYRKARRRELQRRELTFGPDCLLNKVVELADLVSQESVSADQRLRALNFLLNLAGDLHHPLHIARNDDAHGDALRVRRATQPAKATNLYEFWSSEAVAAAAAQGGAEQAVAAQFLGAYPAEMLHGWTSGTPREWMEETTEVTRRVVYDLGYSLVKADDLGVQSVLIEPEYEAQAAAATQEQLVKAGVRLAWLLDAAFATR